MRLETVFKLFFHELKNINYDDNNIYIYNLNYKTKETDSLLNLFIECGNLLAISFLLGDTSFFFDNLTIIDEVPEIDFSNINIEDILKKQHLTTNLSSKDIAEIIIENSVLPKTHNFNNDSIKYLLNHSNLYGKALIHSFSLCYIKVCLHKNNFIQILNKISFSSVLTHKIKSNLLALNKFDLKRQQDFLATIFDKHNIPNKGVNPFPIMTSIKTAQYLADFIIESSILSYNSKKIDRAWIGYINDPLNKFKIIEVIDDSLKNGSLGIAFFLLNIYKESKIQYYLIISSEILDSVIKRNSKSTINKELLFVLDYYNKVSNSNKYLNILARNDFTYSKNEFNHIYESLKTYIKKNSITIKNYSSDNFKYLTSLHNVILNNGLSSIGLKLLYL